MQSFVAVQAAAPSSNAIRFGSLTIVRRCRLWQWQGQHYLLFSAFVRRMENGVNCDSFRTLRILERTEVASVGTLGDVVVTMIK